MMKCTCFGVPMCFFLSFLTFLIDQKILFVCIEHRVSYDMGEELDLPPSPPTISPGLMSRLSPMTLLGKGKVKGDMDPLAVGVSLANLIERRQWSSVVARVRQDPLEAEQELQVMTRGGFMASTGLSPLHYACERRPPVDVVRCLMEAFPVATLTRAMPGGCLPLHIACTWGSSPEVVSALLAADAGSVRVKDELGNIALHSACFSGADIKVVEALLHYDPKSVLARNHQGSRPFDICKRLRHENRRVVMNLLTQKKEEILKTHNRDGSSGMLSDIAREAEEMNQRYVSLYGGCFDNVVSLFELMIAFHGIP
jgi:Ankyrin repeats (3 copies)